MFTQSLTGVKPHKKTKTDRIKKGRQAWNVLPALWIWAAGVPMDPPETDGTLAVPLAPPPAVATAESSSKRQIFFGFQKSRNTTVHRSEKRPAVMYTRLLSILLDQNNFIEAKETPTTVMAGRNST